MMSDVVNDDTIAQAQENLRQVLSYNPKTPEAARLKAENLGQLQAWLAHAKEVRP